MGSYAELFVDDLSIDWSKNEYISFHGALFREPDLISR